MDPELLRDLLDNQPDTLRARKLLGDMTLMPAATADSIFRVLGYPANPIRVNYEDMKDAGAAAEFDPRTRQITFNPSIYLDAIGLAADMARQRRGSQSVPTSEIAAVLQGSAISDMLAHEVAHEATIGEGLDGDTYEWDIRNPDLLGFFNVFMDKFGGLSGEQKLMHYLDYHHKSLEDLPEEELREGGTFYPPAFEPTPQEVREILATTLERGSAIARAFDPEDPSKISEQIDMAERSFPGTREAVNYWIRSFLHMGK